MKLHRFTTDFKYNINLKYEQKHTIVISFVITFERLEWNITTVFDHFIS